MAFKINSSGINQPFLFLKESQRALSESINRLSSDKRITGAADDASGMAIANSLKSQVRGLGQSIRNASDAIAIAQVADGALAESSELMLSIREKALQAANASQSPQSRQALQADIDKSLTALDNIAQNTSYNGQKLLSGQYADKSFQVGASSGETVDLAINRADTQSLGVAAGGLDGIDVTTDDGAQQAVSVVDAALAEIDSIRSNLGSTQNQLASTIENLSLTQINIASAASEIDDLDFAEESLNFSKMQALDKARSFALAQGGKANKQNMLDLLQG